MNIKIKSTETDLTPPFPFLSKSIDCDPGFVPCGTAVYRNSREGMTRQLKALDMALRRAPVWESIKRENLIKKITKLKSVTADMGKVIKMTEGI